MVRTTGPGQPLSDKDGRRAGQVRRIVRARLVHSGLGSFTSLAQLAVTELVTNSFRYGRGHTVGVRMWWCDPCLRIEVGDGSAVTLPADRPEADDVLAESGRGLCIVEAIAAHWGLTADRTGVWCVLAKPGNDQ
ncbi:ATP-binding protein [Streptomyces sp. NPDC001985]|uniref:ATP-binding protein n=1 Tax=Streptomyces sp. NPDC001985 TaxID=3154406 RepID=UPI0033174676